MRGAGDDTWRDVPVTRPYTEEQPRARSGRHGRRTAWRRRHRASGEMAYHVLEVMHAVETASREGRHIEIASTCERPTRR